MKRALDVLGALCGLLVLFPLLAAIALAVWLEDRGSPWFRGVRVGRRGKRFKMLKFRTMIPDAWKSGVSSTACGDRRITRVGMFLRRIKLDELPQLWNVLTGDMSLVGPRPQVEADAEIYSGLERRLFEIRPGITDLASIVFADEGEILEGAADPDLLYNQIVRPWKSQLGLLYLDRRSLGTDVRLLGLTFLSAISRERALAGIEHLLVRWDADPRLRRMARRRQALLAWPPPGAHSVVSQYPTPAVKALPERTGNARVGVLDQIREVRLEDLLGRMPARWQDGGLRDHLRGRTVLVTGAGGSIGSELCRQIARYRPEALIGFDLAETALYQVEQELRERFPGLAFHAAVGNIQNPRRLEELFLEHGPQSVYHAAAYKHVPLMEAHPFEAVENNIFGTRNLVWASSRHRVEEFVLVSSDKAVRPAGVMGATKRVAEMICQAEQRSATRFLAVRFGNVLGSSGSVIPLFKRQIEAGGPVTVTHPEMRRFFMTIPEAAELVLQAASMDSGWAGGEVFVLDMGPPVRILDLARKMILLSGLRPDVDIPIVFSGPRPGEKLFEEVQALEEYTECTPHAQIRMFSGLPPEAEPLRRALEDLERAVEERQVARVIALLQEIVPDYTPSEAAGSEAMHPREAVASGGWA